MHPDHVGGPRGRRHRRCSPNATVRADQADADFWLSAANLEAALKESKGFFQGAQASLKPYVDAGRFKAFTADGTLVPGVKAVATHGHPAHRSTPSSQGPKLVLWGDLMHVAAVQFPTRRVTIAFDTDQNAALAAPQGLRRCGEAGYCDRPRTCRSPASARCVPRAPATFQPTNYTTQLK